MAAPLFDIPTVPTATISAEEAAYIAGVPKSRLRKLIKEDMFPEPEERETGLAGYDLVEVVQWADMWLKHRADLVREAYVSPEELARERKERGAAVGAAVDAMWTRIETAKRIASAAADPESNVIYPSAWHKPIIA